MIEKTIADWHRLTEQVLPGGLDELLADDVVFHSPVVHTPQVGKAVTAMYLQGALYALAEGKPISESKFEYVREILDGNNAMLEFRTEIDGIEVNGIDIIQCNDQGQISDFKVMIRPLKAVNTVHQKMMAMLEQMKAQSA